MAIQKKVINKSTKPEALCEFPDNTCHEAGPEPFEHCPCPPKKEIHLCKDFDDAVTVCSQIFLKPGETHTEFYKDDDKKYHCVIAIGNINPDKGHLYLSDSGSDEALNVQIANLNTKITNINSIINQINESITELTEIVSKNTEDISTLNDNIININEQLTSLNAFRKSIEERVKALEERANKTDIEINDINSSISVVNTSIANLDSRITELEKLTPITDSSIKSLFHSPFEDAYTVNLCCYTSAGRVEIYDYKEDYEYRVADCTPINEYKTYNEGDRITFKAVANDGYKFYKWLKDDVVLEDKIETLDVSFINKDINVIGTLNDGESGDSFEREPLKNGYTALFKKLMKLELSIDVSTRDGIVVIPEDEIIVKVNGEEKTGDVIYVEVNDLVELEAKPADHHNFLHFEINGIEEQGEEGKYSLEIQGNTTVTGFFKELKYYIHGEPDVAQHGDVSIDPHKDFVLEGTIVKLTATPVEDYTFSKWILDNNDPWAKDPEHKDWSSTDNPINITAGEIDKDWDINAVFIAEGQQVTFMVGPNATLYAKNTNE